VVGEFARARRDRVVLVTKFGIDPPPRKRLWQALKPVARGLLSLAHRLRSDKLTASIRGQIRQRVSSQVQHGRFDVSSARESVNRSLKALRTDFLDLLLLHSAKYEQIADGKVIDFLEKEVAAGKVRAVGVSSDAANADRIVTAFPSLAVVQMTNNLADRQIDSFRPMNRVGLITNSPFGGRPLVERLLQVSARDRKDTDRWIEQTGFDLRSETGISQLLLAYALDANPDGVVVCGMHGAGHIIQNVTLADRAPLVRPSVRKAVEEILQLLQ
jgi:aryl-alcohol dehydrogenase-like predicted oxidoreductase